MQNNAKAIQEPIFDQWYNPCHGGGMLRNVWIIGFLFCVVHGSAQSVSDSCAFTFFESGYVSTMRCMNSDGYSYTTSAYNEEGQVIDTWQESRMHVLSSVIFTFHPNGGIAKAVYSSHPDGGIQWYRSTSEYNQQGVRVDFTEESSGDNGYEHQTIVPHPKLNQDKSVNAPSEEMQCAVIYTSELWMDNQSGRNVYLKVRSLSISNDQSQWILLKKGEAKKVGEQIQAQFFESPLNRYSIEIYNRRKKRIKSIQWSVKPTIHDDSAAEHRRRYTYELIGK